MKIKMRKKISPIVLLIGFLFIFIAVPRISEAKFYAKPFLGASGTGIIWGALDIFLEADGKIAGKAFEYGLFTGEFGLALDWQGEHFGFRPEILAGYYKFRFWDLPNTAYTMFNGGAEFYLRFSEFQFGIGNGYFHSLIYDEIMGYQISPGVYYPGRSHWVSFTIEDRNWDLDFRLRWHHFWAYREIGIGLNDTVFIVRLNYKI